MADRYSPSELGFEALSARSVALSALLGEHPPSLPGRALIALAQVPGIAEGAMRTALSRMIQAGELTMRDGEYALQASMLTRQRAQDYGRSPAPSAWDGAWWFAIVEADRRALSERRAFRARMRQHRMAELRPEVWLRPANTAGPDTEAGVLVVRGPLHDGDPAALVSRLWDVDELERRAAQLLAMAQGALSWIGTGEPDALRDASLLTVSVLRFLFAEPRLPPTLLGHDRTIDDLRFAYDRFELAYRRTRSAFLAESVSNLDRHY